MIELHLPADRLPADSAQRHAALRDYFCDKDATAEREPDGWRLRLNWPDGEARHVDPRLDEGLAWWGDGVVRPTMASARRRSGAILSTLYDTWTLQSWSEWAHRHGLRSESDLLVLHVDDHRDLGVPRLFMENEGWRDPMTGRLCNLGAPASVLSAIESGALGMGSFLTPFLHAFPRAQVRHLCQPPKATTTTDFRIVRTTSPDYLLDPGVPRPAIALVETPGETGPGHYRVTPSVDAWLEEGANGPVLLHIDMDYFNNRFDGDSDWASRINVLDPDIDEVLGKIDEMMGALQRTGFGRRLDDIVIAFSPGFFPAEMWGPASARLHAALERLHEP